jgi:hypothetical protein
MHPTSVTVARALSRCGSGCNGPAKTLIFNMEIFRIRPSFRKINAIMFITVNRYNKFTIYCLSKLNVSLLYTFFKA